jgi:hypothetical protein
MIRIAPAAPIRNSILITMENKRREERREQRVESSGIR